ncbi:MFS transporter [bacterium]|jgi:EmrB/QacA subfamily drug resistance transporter|nr:MFS transporter [bacterium]
MAQKWWVLAAVACGTFMATLDSSIVNIALPTLTKELNTSLYEVKWVIIIYLLVITCLLLPFGRISDQYGRKRIFQAAFIIFTLGSAMCGLAEQMTWLLVFRAIQGIGAAMLMANGPAVITAAFPAGERGKALGTLAMVVSSGLILGPSIGGILISRLGWESIFLVNIPVGIVGSFLVHRFVEGEKDPRPLASFDWAGTITQVIFILSLILLMEPPLIAIAGSGFFPIPRWVLALFTAIFGALFIKIESQTKYPVFDLSLLKNRTFWTAILASFLIFISYSSLAVLMPFFLEEVLHYSPEKAGLFMTAIPFTIFVIAPISGILSDRFGSMELSIAGAAVGAIGLFIMAGIFGMGMHEEISRVGIILALCSIGLATGLFQSPNNNAIMGAVPANKLGVASALIATVRNLGMVTGTGLATAIFAWRIRLKYSFVDSLHFTFYVAGIISVGATIASFGKKRGPMKS